MVEAKKIVNESIAAAVNDCLSAEDAFDNYRMFGDDPWITGNGPIPDGKTFSDGEKRILLSSSTALGQGPIICSYVNLKLRREAEIGRRAQLKEKL